MTAGQVCFSSCRSLTTTEVMVQAGGIPVTSTVDGSNFFTPQDALKMTSSAPSENPVFARKSKLIFSQCLRSKISLLVVSLLSNKNSSIRREESLFARQNPTFMLWRTLAWLDLENI